MDGDKFVEGLRKQHTTARDEKAPKSVKRNEGKKVIRRRRRGSAPTVPTRSLTSSVPDTRPTVPSIGFVDRVASAERPGSHGRGSLTHSRAGSVADSAARHVRGSHDSVSAKKRKPSITHSVPNFLAMVTPRSRDNTPRMESMATGRSNDKKVSASKRKMSLVGTGPMRNPAWGAAPRSAVPSHQGMTCCSILLADKLPSRGLYSAIEVLEYMVAHARADGLQERIGSPVPCILERDAMDLLCHYFVRFEKEAEALLNRMEREGFISKREVTDGSSVSCAYDCLPLGRDAQAPKPVLTVEQQRSIEFDLLSASPVELARQLTMMEQRLFQEIVIPMSFRNCSKAPLSTPVQRLVDFSNAISRWVASTVLTCPAADRLDTLALFIRTAVECKKIRNFSAAVSISGAFSMMVLARLELMWEKLSPKLIKAKNELETLASPLNNFGKQRQLLKETSSPTLPSLPMFLKDLTLIELGNSDESVQVELQRPIMDQLRLLQQQRYTFKHVYRWQHVLTEMLLQVVEERDLQRHSDAVRAESASKRARVPPLRSEVVDELSTQLQLHAMDAPHLFTRFEDMKAVSRALQTFNSTEREKTFFDGALDNGMVASVLMAYISQQPFALVPFRMLAEEFYEGLPEDVQAKKILECLCSSDLFPQENKGIFWRLMDLGISYYRRREQNGATAEELGDVFGPVVTRTAINPTKAKIAGDIFTVLFKHDGTVMAARPNVVGSDFRIFEGAPELTEADWDKLLVNATRVTLRDSEVLLVDGHENHKLFLLASGELRVLKRGFQVSTMTAPSIVGEMSFLGRYTVSATVSAVSDCVLFAIDLGFVNNMLQVDRQLFRSFYWNLARELCARLRQIPFQMCRAALSSLDIIRRRETKTTTQRNFIKVYFEDESFETLVYTDYDTLEHLHAEILNRLRLASSSNRFYEYLPRFQRSLECQTNELVALKAHSYRQLRGYRLYFASKCPEWKPVDESKTSLDQSVKLFTCKCVMKRSGTLFICQDSIFHVHTILGFEKKTVINISAITKLSRTSQTAISISEINLKVSNASKKHSMSFKSVLECSNAVQLIEALRTDRGMETQSRESVTRSLRGVVVADFKPSSERELDLCKGDSILIMRQEPGREGWWVGDIAGRRGLFPEKHVEVYTIDGSRRALRDKDCSMVADLPDKEDWELILLGGRVQNFSDGEIILQQGNTLQRIHQIVDGKCRVEEQRGRDEPPSVLRTMGEGEIFGEMSMLLGGGANATVVAEGSASVYIIEAEYLKRLFQCTPDQAAVQRHLSYDSTVLAGRFFKYLAIVVEQRLRDQTERRASKAFQQQHRSSVPPEPSKLGSGKHVA